MKTIKVMRDGRPATAEELACAVDGKPLTPLTGSTFVVTAYRWGLRDAHSYVVGAYPTWQMAMSAANAHIEYRGGKYGVEVTECSGQEDEGGENGNTADDSRQSTVGRKSRFSFCQQTN